MRTEEIKVCDGDIQGGRKVMTFKDINDLSIAYGKTTATLAAIKRILENTEYSHDAVRTIKCILGIVEDKEEKA